MNTTEQAPMLKLYAIRNRDGQYFRAKGYGGCGKTWVDNLTKARVWPRTAPARAQITYFATSHSKYGVPKLVELHVTRVVEVDETARVKKVVAKKELNTALRAVRNRRDEIRRAEENLASEQARLDRLKHPEADERLRDRMMSGLKAAGWLEMDCDRWSDPVSGSKFNIDSAWAILMQRRSRQRGNV